MMLIYLPIDEKTGLKYKRTCPGNRSKYWLVNYTEVKAHVGFAFDFFGGGRGLILF